MNYNSDNTPNIKHVNILYLVCMLLFVGTGFLLRFIQLPEFGYNGKMITIVLTQVSFVFLPMLIYLLCTKPNIRETFRFNKVSFLNIIISMALMAVAMIVAGLINAIVLLILNYFGKMHEPTAFPSENVYQLIINILVVALTPAIFEELFFRGVVFKSYESVGKVKALLMSSLLFALLHRDIQSLVGTFILGLVIAYIVYRTNSIFAGMAAHFTNNGLAVFLTYLSSKMMDSNIENTQNVMEQLQALDISIIIAMIIMLVFFVVIIFSIFVGLLFLIRVTTRNISREKPEYRIQNVNYTTYMPLFFSFALVLLIFVGQLL